LQNAPKQAQEKSQLGEKQASSQTIAFSRAKTDGDLGFYKTKMKDEKITKIQHKNLIIGVCEKLT